MSGESRDQALQHLRKAESELERGRYSDALRTLGKAGRLADEAQTPDILSIVIGTVGRAMQSAGRYDEALTNHTIALNIQNELAKHDPFFNTWVATTLNNLGNLLLDMGRIDDAMKRYEGALNIYTEPMQYMTIRAKSRTIVNIIQLLSNSAEKETNKLKKQKYLKIYIQHITSIKRFSPNMIWTMNTDW